MEYFNNILCVTGSELIRSEQNPEGIVSASLIKKWQRDDKAITVRRACYGQSLLLNFNRIPGKYRDEIATKLGVPAEEATTKPFKDKVLADPKAVEFFSHYMLENGKHLPEPKQREYATNAAVLNAIRDVHDAAKQSRTKLGQSINGFWSKAIAAVNETRVQLQHTLPAKQVPLSRVFGKYITNGYGSLISGKWCNNNSRKVSEKIENLIISLYTADNKPFAADVYTCYNLFMTGKWTVPCRKTGEILNPQDYYENEEPIILAKSTIWNYLNQPWNRTVAESKRSGQHNFRSTQRPHHHRHAPNFSLSKVSMDDRDLPRKCAEGIWVKAYYAYDVASQCIVGFSHSKKKDERLFIDCLRNMFRMIDRERFGMPAQVEVEHHLVNKFFDDLGEMFSFVRICNPGNSQEKHAEHMNRQKKYGIEKKRHKGIGRWWSKHEAYRTDRDKINDEFVEKVYDYDTLVADDISDIQAYNNAPHPNQKRYPGKTRWEVLKENLNPILSAPSKALIYKSIGEHTATAIRRSQYVVVREQKYFIPTPDVMEMLEPGNHSVDAYYMPDADGMIPEVYLYHKGKRLCVAAPLETFNTANAEWTDKDRAAYAKQSKYVSQFDAKVKKDRNELMQPMLIESQMLKEAVNAPVEVAPEPSEQIIELQQDFDTEDFDDEQAAIDAL